MPEEQPARRIRVKRKIKAAVKEFVRLCDAIQPEKNAMKLQVDMARDAGLDAFGKMLRHVKKLERRLSRSRSNRHATHDRLVSLLGELATGPVVLPRPDGLPPIDPLQLDEVFSQLKTHDFPTLSANLRDATQHAEAIAYERYLVEEFFVKGSAILAEHLVREARRPHPVEDENQFLEKLRHHLSGNVQKAILRQTSYELTTEDLHQIDLVLVRTLRFLLDLLTISPPRRLLLPPLGTPYDPARHEVVPGRPDSGTVLIRATIFPGCVSLETPPKILARALVYTKASSSDAAIPTSTETTGKAESS